MKISVSANLTNGDATVTAPGASFLTDVSVGDHFHRQGENVGYVVASVTDNENLELSATYNGATASGVTCYINDAWTPVMGFPIHTAGDPDGYVTVTKFVRMVEEVFTGTRAVSSMVIPTVYGSTAANGDITIEGTSHATKTSSYVILQPSGGKVGIGTTAPDRMLEINDAAGACLRLTYNDSNGSASNYVDFSVSSGGDLTVAPSGGDTNITGALAVSGATTLASNGLNVGAGQLQVSGGNVVASGNLTVSGGTITTANDGNGFLYLGRYNSGDKHAYIVPGAGTSESGLKLRVVNSSSVAYDVVTLNANTGQFTASYNVQVDGFITNNGAGVYGVLNVGHLDASPQNQTVSAQRNLVTVQNGTAGMAGFRAESDAGATYDGKAALYAQWYNGSDYVWKQVFTAGFNSGVVTAGNITINGTGTSSVAGDWAVAATKKLYLDGGSNTYLDEVSADVIRIVSGGTEAARVNAARFWKASNAGSYQGSTASYHELRSNVEDDRAVFISSTATSPYGADIAFPSASPDNNTNYFLNCWDGTTTRAKLYSDGDWVNHDNSYGAISDMRTKRDVIEVDDEAQLADVLAMRWVKYRNVDDIEQYGDAAPYRLGLDSAALRRSSPGLVKKRLMGYRMLDTVNYSVAAEKFGPAIRALAARNVALEARLAALEARA